MSNPSFKNNKNLTILPVGMNYFNGHRFRGYNKYFKLDVVQLLLVIH